MPSYLDSAASRRAASGLATQVCIVGHSTGAACTAPATDTCVHAASADSRLAADEPRCRVGGRRMSRASQQNSGGHGGRVRKSPTLWSFAPSPSAYGLTLFFCGQVWHASPANANQDALQTGQRVLGLRWFSGCEKCASRACGIKTARRGQFRRPAADLPTTTCELA